MPTMNDSHAGFVIYFNCIFSPVNLLPYEHRYIKLYIMPYQRLILLCLIISASPLLNANNYVGAGQCKSCHQKEYELWKGSHHDMAMKHANENSVLGNFNDVSIKLSKQTSRFYMKDKQYWVNTQGPDGKLHDYPIKYTFGYEPLQQYMVEFNDGRVQLIPYAWDSRSKQQGGQRWFNLYPEITEPHQEFYWTNTGQNWNYMCADCHSTNVKKNFNIEKNQYATTWSEINVACEACHGPASEHIKWSRDKASHDRTGDTGFDRDLSKPVKQWLNEKGNPVLQPQSIHPTQQTMMCAQCHSRHTQLSDNDYLKTDSFGDRYLLNLINAENYYADGQIYDEVYIYGSFLQSKMFKKGVTCSNCHDPHSAKLKLPKETLCIQCHESAIYNTRKHHHHSGTPTGKATGTQCVDCHMPQTTYMQIDQRADHSWHVPRPDLSLKLGTPDTCLSCHEEKDSQWSLQQITEWYAKSTVDKGSDFAPAFALADRVTEPGYPQVSSELAKVSQDKNYAGIIRASALEHMSDSPDQNSLISIARGVRDKDELIRLGAILGAQNMPQDERWQLLEPMLSDKVLVIRTEAASMLAPLWQSLNEKQRATLQPALDDYLQIQDFNADRGFAHTNRGNILAHMGHYAEAETAYDQSIRIDPTYSTAYVNKAELYRRQQASMAIDANKKEEKIIATLKQGIKAQPDGGDLYYSLGLSMIRSKKISEAIAYLEKATEVDPLNANYHYVYALSLEQTQPELAQKAMHDTYQISGNPRHLYALCEMQIKQNAFQAKRCLSRLAKVVPAEVVTQLKQMLSESSKK
jgi:predicted CXXCH cytochrome family protein